LIFVFTLIFILSISLIALGANKNTAVKQVTNDSKLSFGNLSLNIEANNTNLDITKAVLEFIPLSSKTKSEEKSDFSVKLGNNKSRIEKITAIPKELIDKNIIEINHGKQFIKIKTPTTTIPYLKLVDALKLEQVAEFEFPDSYYSAIEDAQTIILEHEIRKVSEIKNKNSKGWLHLYPLDKMLLEFSFNPQQMVIASDIEINTPSYLDSNININSSEINIDLIKDGDTYTLKKSATQSIFIPARKNLTVKGELKRYWTERDLLTVGQVIIAIVLGIVSGIFARNSNNVNLSLLFKELIPIGGGALGLYVLHNNVMSKHSDLPSILSGGIPTIFELFTFGSVLLIFPSVAFLALRKEWEGLVIFIVIILVATVGIRFVLP
jgi:hypothetical protein